MKRLDDQLLCNYIDGTLGSNEAAEIADWLAVDAEGRVRLTQLLGARARLRAYGTSLLAEPAPLNLLGTVRRAPLGRIASWAAWPVLRYAAAVVLVISGFFLGRLQLPAANASAQLFPMVPIGLQQVVNATLELEPSGQERSWQDRQGLSARIVPVRTFRGEGGQYYRMFTLELSQDDQMQRYTAIARRTGKEEWQTRSLALEETPSSI